MAENDKEDAIRKTFNMLDMDGNGYIDVKELERFILNQGMNIPQEELQLLIEKIDSTRRTSTINRKNWYKSRWKNSIFRIWTNYGENDE